MPRKSLTEVVGDVLATLPQDGSKVPFEDFRQSVLQSGIENGLAAVGEITKRKLAKLDILPRPGLEVDENGKVKPNQARPHVLLFISKL